MSQIAGARDAAAFMPLAEALILAERHRAAGRLAEAEALCRRLLDFDPKRPEAEHLIGVIAHQGGRLGEAIEHLRRAVKHAPKVALYHANLGEMLRMSGRPKLAVEEARRALELDPNMPAALSNLGAAFYDLEDYEEAVRANRKAIAAKPDFAEAHTNLGNALHGLRRFDEAVAAYRRAVELNPSFADGWANLGNALHHSGEFEEAMAALRHAIALSPEQANARSGLGILLLMRGDLGEGWDEYEWRLRSTERKGPLFPERPWQGESLAGKHIYVQAEQGFGDTLQFVRYMPLLAQRAAKVSLRVHQELTGLLRENLPGIEVLGDRGVLAPYDCDTVLLSLPRLFKTRLETIPATVPYLRAPPAAVSRWTARLNTMQGLKVGIVWAGNPKHVNDIRRSLDLAMLAPIFKVPGISFASLQVGPRAADLKKPKHRDFKITDLSREVVDFCECAAAMTALDLMITVDTSAAHLAGALGRPTWVLLPWVTDWRWMLEREDNLWYPTMRLYREKRGEGLEPVIAARPFRGRDGQYRRCRRPRHRARLCGIDRQRGHRTLRARAARLCHRADADRPRPHFDRHGQGESGVLSFVLDGCRSEDVGKALNQEGIAVRAGHHCAQPILRRFGVESTVRPSLAFYNKSEDVDALVAALHRIQAGRSHTARA